MIRRIYVKLHITMLHTKYRSFGSCGFKEEDFTCISHYKTMTDDDAPGAGLVWTPGAWLAGFIKKTTIHCYTQNMEVLGLVVSEKKIFFYVCPIVSQWELMTPKVGPFLTLRGMTRRISVTLHITMLQTKYKSFGCCGFREEDFSCISLYKPMSDNDDPGRGLYGPQGQGWQDL